MTSIKFLSAPELIEIAGRESSKTLPDEDADTFPVPKKVGSEIVILVMFFRASGLPDNRTVRPPHYAMHLDPVTGSVLRFWPTTAAELGIAQPQAVVKGVGVLPTLSSAEYVAKRKRFLELSNDVWIAFAQGGPAKDPGLRARVQEYWQLFSQITPRAVAPFYLQAAPEFFAWVEAAK